MKVAYVSRILSNFPERFGAIKRFTLQKVFYTKRIPIYLRRTLPFYIFMVFLSVFYPTQIHGQFSGRKNFVLYHYSANRQYELISIPESDVGDDSPLFIYVNERKSGRCLYQFSPELLIDGSTDYLFLLSNDGKTVYQFYANLNGGVHDPSIRLVLVYKEGIPSETIKDKEISDFLNGFCYPYNIRKLTSHYTHKRSRKKKIQRLKSNRGSIEAWGDTLRLQGWRKSVLHCSYSTFKPITPTIKTDNNNHYRKFYYRIVYMDAYKREKLYDQLDKKWHLMLQSR